MRQLRKLLSLHIVVPVLVAVVAGGVILGTAIALDSGNSTNVESIKLLKHLDGIEGVKTN